MEDLQHRGLRHARRRTIGFLMIVIAAVGLMCALLKPFTITRPSSGEVIGVSFDIVKTRAPDGSTVLGASPKFTITKRAGADAQPRSF